MTAALRLPHLRHVCAILTVLAGLELAPALEAHDGHTPGPVLGADDACPPAVVTNLTRFQNPLVLPPVAQPILTNAAGILVYEMPMTSLSWKIDTNLPPVEVWGYAGSYPGPTIEAEVNTPVEVRWLNRLPTVYPSWLVNPGQPDAPVRTVVHLHGAAVEPQFDGNPTNTFVFGEGRTNQYPNVDFSCDGETLWYHDHALGYTANDVYSGLAGFYLLRNSALERKLKLPVRAYEIPLLFQDRDIQTNCMATNLAFNFVPPWHYLAVVNGQAWPYHVVEPRRYRLRMLNGSNFRTIGLGLDQDGNSIPFHLIGTDDGFMPTPIATNLIHLMPAERADVIVDFTELKGKRVRVTNFTQSPPDFDFGSIAIDEFMEFRVLETSTGPDDSEIPVSIVADCGTPAESAEALAARATMTREITLDFSPQPDPTFVTPISEVSGPPAWLNLKHFEAPVDETPTLGAVEIWSFVNLTDEPHPIHIHLIDFQVLDRTPFLTNFVYIGRTNLVPVGVARYLLDRAETGAGATLGPLAEYLDNTLTQPQFASERGPKDVVSAAAFSVTRVVIQWPDEDRFSGSYVYHCHILDHEDDDMMRPIWVLHAVEPGRLLSQYDSSQNQILLELGTKLGTAYDVQISPNLLSWQSWTNVVGTGATVGLMHPVRDEAPRQYYRAVSQ